MSIRVEPGLIDARLRDGNVAHLVTARVVGDEVRSHVVALRPHIAGSRLTFDGAGRTTVAGVRTNAQVTVLWAPSELRDDEHVGYSLIADGVATIAEGDAVVVEVRRAVLHRPAP